MNGDQQVAAALEQLKTIHPAIFSELPICRFPRMAPQTEKAHTIINLLQERLQLIHDLVVKTALSHENEIQQAINQLARWMEEGAIVRVLGAGRARLAAAIPANRLAHGGARVYLQDDVVPMPHSLHGGGIIAASASGKTPSVLSALHQARDKNKEIAIIGVAAKDASEFAALCSIFIGIPAKDKDPSGGLRALADIEEYAISELLDALVVAAGISIGYTDASWRLGHEDLGLATGPYDFRPTVL
jgi:D-arabinose 5-phosphate isomerase GutQ